MNYSEYAKKERMKIVSSSYFTFRNDEDFQDIPDEFLWSICKSWVESESKLNFENFVDHYFDSMLKVKK